MIKFLIIIDLSNKDFWIIKESIKVIRFIL